jgi:hypothetical protein
VEGTCHNPISEIEGFFNPISMVDIDINIEHSLVRS